MCTQPKNIVNPCADPKFGTRVFLTVPCASCKECTDAKVRGYLLRNFLEYKFVTQSEGYAFFDTLTYNNDCIPQTNGIYHFNSRHVKNFMKRLRIYLCRLYGIRSNAFKFWLVCEYGGNTYRPHYHVLFYVYGKISVNEFKRCINKAWTYGFTDSIYKTKRHVLKSCAAVRYLMKYLAKYRDFDTFVKDFGKKIDFDFMKLPKEQLRMYRPFIRQSVNLGYNDSIDLLSCDFVQIPNKDHTDLFCYSDYYKRKQLYQKVVIYNEDGTTSYKRTPSGSYVYELSKRGFEYKTKNFDKLVKSRIDKLSQLYSVAPLDIRLDIDFLLNGRSLHDLALFDIVFSYKLFDLTFLHLNYDVKKSWDDFCFNVYSDSLQVTQRCFDSDYFIQAYYDHEFPETANMYSIIDKFHQLESLLKRSKHEKDSETIISRMHLDKLVKSRSELPCSAYYQRFNFIK